MKTRTFDVFLTKNGLGYLNSGTGVMVHFRGEGIKAKLIVELPERTGTITESDFDALMACAAINVPALRKKIFNKDTQ